MKGDSVKSKSSAELRAMRDGRQVAPAGSSRQQRLDSYREVIVRRQRDFVETGTALGLIAKDNLFKEAGHASFEAMVTDEFDMSTSTAYRLVDAARVVTILSQVGTVESKIRNQSQALALAPLGKDREAMVLTIAAAEARGKLTADLLATVRVELYPHTEVIEGEVVPERPAVVAGMRKAIERAAEPKPRCEACGKTLDEATVKAAQHRCVTCDPDRDHFSTEVGGPRLACNPKTAAGQPDVPADGAASTSQTSVSAAAPAGSVDASLVDGPGNPQTAAVQGAGSNAEFEAGVQRGLERLATQDSPAADTSDAVSQVVLQQPGAELHEQENGWAGPNGDCGASCTCGVMFDGFDTIAEARALLDLHIANPEERDEEEGASVEQDSPTHVEGRGSETDSPAGLEPHGPGSDAPEPPAVATTVLPGIDHHDGSGVARRGEALVEESRPSAALELEDGGRTSHAAPSSSDPDEQPVGDQLMNAFATLVHYLDQLDVDAVGPLLFGEDIETLHSHAEAISAYVTRIGKARFAEMLHTP